MCGGGGILSTVGSLAGSFFGGPIGGAVGGAIGGLLGGKKSSGSGNSASAEQAKAEADAVNRANVQTAMRRKALRDQSLFTGAGDSAAPTNTLGVGG